MRIVAASAQLVRIALAVLVTIVAPHMEAWAQQQGNGKRVALVIGNSAYKSVSPLANPGNDAQLLADTLRKLGFSLVGGGANTDLGKIHFDQMVRQFGEEIVGAEVALFYYAGHGLQVHGTNWLAPVDANPTRTQDLDFQMVNADVVLHQMEGAGTRLNILILDACRNNPFAGRGLRAATGGLAEMRAPEGALISYATQPGNVALDGSGANSPFAAALARTMQQKGLDIFRTFNEVGIAVKRQTGGAQQPWVNASPIEGEFYFAGAPDQQSVAALAPNASSPLPAAPLAASPATPLLPSADREALFWQSIMGSSNGADFEAYLRAYPSGAFAQLARNRLVALNLPRQPPSASEPPAQSDPARNRPASTPELFDTNSAAKEAVTFANTYFSQWSRSNEVALPYLEHVYGEQITFYGKQITREALMEVKRKFVERWPVRVYTVRQDSMSSQCNRSSFTCTVTGIVDWDCRSPAREARSSGAANFGLRVLVAAAGRISIVGESGSVISNPPEVRPPVQTAVLQPQRPPNETGIPDGWREFRPPDGELIVLLPGEPKLTVVPRDQNGHSEHRYLVNLGTKGYFVAWDEYAPGHLTKATPKAILDLAQGVLLKGLNGTLRTSKPVTTAGYPGREILFDTPDHNTGKVHLYLVRDRLYQAWYIGPTGEETRPEVDRFLNSFRLTGR
jgi:uncharacterized caspase-like protein